MGVVYEAFDRERHERVALKTLLHFDAAASTASSRSFGRSPTSPPEPRAPPRARRAASATTSSSRWSSSRGPTSSATCSRAAAAARRTDQTAVVTVDSRAQRARRARASRRRRRRAREPRADARVARRLRQAPAGAPAARRGRARAARGGQAAPRHQAVERARDARGARRHPRLRRRDRAARAHPDGRSTASDEVVGTATYMAPEQASGERADRRLATGTASARCSTRRSSGARRSAGRRSTSSTLKCTVDAARAVGVRRGRAATTSTRSAARSSRRSPEDRPGAAEILRRLGATPSDQAPAPASPTGSESTLPRRPRAASCARCATRSRRRATGRPVTVRVAGLSGLGKSAARAPLPRRARAARATSSSCAGRAYERESVPYKAVDSVDRRAQPPPDATSTRRGEPARRCPTTSGRSRTSSRCCGACRASATSPAAPVGDPQVVRQRAFAALRELFSALSRRQRVVVFIDDVQWGDTDSAALLLELMRPPDAPPLLLVMTHRDEEAETSPFLAELRARWPEERRGARPRRSGPSSADDARRLALSPPRVRRRVRAGGPPRRSRASRAAARSSSRSSRAAPARYHRVGDRRRPPGARRGRRSSRWSASASRACPDDARRLLEIVAVGGRPLPVSSVGAAAARGRRRRTQLVALLRARRFVRVGPARRARGRRGEPRPHPRDDRRAALRRDRRAAPPRELARVLEATPDADPEAIAAHLLGAGDRARAAHYAERAAEQAVAKLAFEQAARLFQLTLETLPAVVARGARGCTGARPRPPSGPARPRRRRARTCAAAEGAPPLERVELERAAAAQLIAAGRIDEGAAVFRRVLAAVGRPVPTSVLGTIFWVIVYRAASALRRALEARARPRELPRGPRAARRRCTRSAAD